MLRASRGEREEAIVVFSPFDILVSWSVLGCTSVFPQQLLKSRSGNTLRLLQLHSAVAVVQQNTKQNQVEQPQRWMFLKPDSNGFTAGQGPGSGLDPATGPRPSGLQDWSDDQRQRVRPSDRRNKLCFHPIKHQNEDSAAGYILFVPTGCQNLNQCLKNRVLARVLKVLMVLRAGTTGTDVGILTTLIVLLTARAETVVFLCKTLTKLPHLVAVWKANRPLNLEIKQPATDLWVPFS